MNVWLDEWMKSIIWKTRPCRGYEGMEVMDSFWVSGNLLCFLVHRGRLINSCSSVEVSYEESAFTLPHYNVNQIKLSSPPPQRITQENLTSPYDELRVPGSFFISFSIFIFHHLSFFLLIYHLWKLISRSKLFHLQQLYVFFSQQILATPKYRVKTFSKGDQRIEDLLWHAYCFPGEPQMIMVATILQWVKTWPYVCCKVCCWFWKCGFSYSLWV